MRQFFSWFCSSVFRRRAVANASLVEDIEIFNEQVPWMLLKERKAAQTCAKLRPRIVLTKPEVDLSRWPGHGAPFLRKEPRN